MHDGGRAELPGEVATAALAGGDRPADKAFDVVDKIRGYFAACVRQVWHVYSNVEQVFVFDSPTSVRIPSRGDDLTGDPVVPEFRPPVADVFPLAEPAP